MRSPQAGPWDHTPPVGCCDGSPNCRHRASPRRPRARVCLRKGCGQKYLPRRWNQRYCQDPDCLREVRRWQAAKRQAKRRLEDTAKAQHAQAQRARRRRAASSPQTPKPSVVASARGHAAKIFFPRGCATGRDVMNQPPPLPADRRVSAVPAVAKPFAEFRIVNASGVSVALSKAVAAASANTPPHAGDAPRRRTIALAPCRRRDRIPPPRRSAVCCPGLQAL